MSEIQKREETEREEQERVKSMGGKRVQIEDTDGSENEEDYEEKAIKIDVDEATNDDNGIRRVNIAEVESDTDESDAEEAVKEQAEEETPPKETVNVENKREFELEARLIEVKDKAYREYRNGQYGDAIRHYNTIIDELIGLAKSRPGEKVVNFFFLVDWNISQKTFLIQINKILAKMIQWLSALISVYCIIIERHVISIYATIRRV